MIAVDLQPYCIARDVGFHRLMSKIAPNYKMPSRKYFSDTIVPDIFQKVKTKIQNSVNEAKYISLTTDIWTATTNNTPFLSLTGHWLSDNFQQERAVLRIVPFEGSHTGARISEVINNVLEDYKLEKSRLFLVLRDSGANMVAGVLNCGLESQACFIHTLQLSVNESIFAQQAVKNIITTGRNIVKHFNHSSSAVNKLKELQDQLNLKNHKLLQDVPTRWNSTYYMLERIIEQRKALVTYAIDANIDTLSTYQWSLAEKIVQLLKPFEEITVEASKREATCSMIIPTIQTMNLFLSRAKTSIAFNGIITTVEELQSSVQKRFSSYLENKSLCLSTVLDPRFKIKFQKADMTKKIKEWTVEEMERVNISESETEDSTIRNNSSDENQDDNSTEQIDSTVPTLTFSNIYDELAFGKSGDEVEERPKKRRMTNEQECISWNKQFQDYLNLPMLQRDDNPFMWWKNSKEQFPLLCKVAMKYLCAPSSSVESERVFSTGGNIYEPTRNRLCPENGEMLMFLHYNLRVLQFDYN